MTLSNPWILTLVYWLHLLATVIWIGGIASMAIIVLPLTQRILDDSQRARLYQKIQERFQPVGWLSLAILFGTGLIQMSVHPDYEGFLNINNPWSVAIFAKHIAILGLVVLMGWMSWAVLPALKRFSLMQALGKSGEGAEKQNYVRQEKWLVKGNLLLSLIILLLTAWARSLS